MDFFFIPSVRVQLVRKPTWTTPRNKNILFWDATDVSQIGLETCYLFDCMRHPEHFMNTPQRNLAEALRSKQNVTRKTLMTFITPGVWSQDKLSAASTPQVSECCQQKTGRDGRVFSGGGARWSGCAQGGGGLACTHHAPSAKPSPAKQAAAGLHQAGLVGPCCDGCCNWAASFVAWPQVLPCLTWCSLTSSKETTVSHSCLKLSYFTGLYLKDPILHGPPGSGTETRTSDVQEKLESLRENPKLGRPCACPQWYWSYTSIWREKDWQ